MRNIILLFSILYSNMVLSQIYKTEKKMDSKGYEYEEVSNDPSKSRIYTLKNGLKVYLSKNEDTPRIQTFIAVRTGSANDPSTNTGLSHYLEHMLFKGTSKIGTINWNEEKKLLDEISDLYEEHKAETNAEEKKKIYKRIDSVSQEASKYAIANEYDKIVSNLGAKGTNAHTWLDETIYKNNIPSNELEKWLYVEKERFSELVLRLFHTELESVYEEFNRAQDNDVRLAYYELMDALFPTHPYGQQTTLGKAEHLKNPSMKAIHEYFSTYYVPNNMALILVGDLEFETTIQLVDKYLGKMEYKELPMIKRVSEKPLTTVTERIVKTPSAERVQIAYRTQEAGSKEAMYVEMVDMILNNSGAGLIDININQKQKAQGSGSYAMSFKEYGMHVLYGAPREGQSLEEVKDLLLEQINKVKKGEFDDWVIKAIINDLKTRRMESWDQANGVATQMYTAFIQKQDWESILKKFEELEKITKQDIINFANDFYKDNYVVVYKEKGINENLIRVENPKITPVKINRTSQSDFYKQLASFPEKEIQPEFVDYAKLIEEDKIHKSPFYYVKNTSNNLAKLYYIFDFGADNSKELALALGYMNLLGTDKYSKSDLEKEFYKAGIIYNISVQNDKTYISLSGLEENIPKGIELLEHLLTQVQVDADVYKNYVQTILKSREDSKTDKQTIFRALAQYAKFGENNRIRNNISEKELREAKPEELTKFMKKLTDYEHSVFYYGTDKKPIQKILNKKHHFGTKVFAEPEKYTEQNTDGTLYFAPYDMVQTEILLQSKSSLFNLEVFPAAKMFNEYFGSGLSSIVFQEIRESRSLAYSAYASYTVPQEKDKHNYVSVYLGTQANKLLQAVETIQELMDNMPEIKEQFDGAKNNALKQIASDRITKTNIFWSYMAMKKIGLDYDIRKNMYGDIQKMKLSDLKEFYNKEIKDREYNISLIGNKTNLDWKVVEKLGKVKELSIEELFNY